MQFVGDKVPESLVVTVGGFGTRNSTAEGIWAPTILGAPMQPATTTPATTTPAMEQTRMLICQLSCLDGNRRETASSRHARPVFALEGTRE